MKALTSACTIIALLGSVLPTAGDSVTVGTLTIERAWARATPPGARVGAGFMEITNTGTDTDRLLAASVDFADKVEIHEMAIRDDVMIMREVEGGLAIEPGETARLAPGGFHLMFMGLKGRLAEGTEVSVTLSFENAGETALPLIVGGLGDRAYPAVD